MRMLVRVRVYAFMKGLLVKPRIVSRCSCATSISDVEAVPQVETSGKRLNFKYQSESGIFLNEWKRKQ